MPRQSTAQPVYRITSVDQGTDEKINARQIRYLVGMSLRTVCFVAAILTDGWLRWTLAVGAVVLPYISVVIANAGREYVRELPVLVLRRRSQPPESASSGTDTPSSVNSDTRN